MDTSEEKKNERKSLYISLGIHGVLLLLFFFLLAWKEPFPPIPEYGIELNFGIDQSGSGTVQRQAPVTPTPTEQPTESESENTESQETEAEEVQEQTESDAVDPEAIPESTEDVAAEEIDSPDVVEAEKSTQTETETEPEVQEEAPSTVVEEPQPESTDAGGVNQGDDDEEVGDKGEPEGKVDERAIYGNPGAGGGASLNLSGWMWDYIPTPDDQSDENGRIVFSITIDDSGEILSIRTLEKTVTPAVERIYRAEVEKLTFSTTSDNTRPAATSTGTITFVIKSN